MVPPYHPTAAGNPPVTVAAPPQSTPKPSHADHPGGDTPSHLPSSIAPSGSKVPHSRRSRHLNTSTESSSDSSDSEDEDQNNHNKRLSGGKSPSFNGDISWAAFYLKFKHFASGHSDRRKLKLLMNCLEGHALTYTSMLAPKDTKDYMRLKKKLSKRFGRHLPATSARQLCASLKQEPHESVLDFSGRVIQTVNQGFPTSEETLQEELSVEYFLKGCNDKSSAMKILDKEPKSLDEALNMLEKLSFNTSFIYGKNPVAHVAQVRGQNLGESTSQPVPVDQTQESYPASSQPQVIQPVAQEAPGSLTQHMVQFVPSTQPILTQHVSQPSPASIPPLMSLKLSPLTANPQAHSSSPRSPTCYTCGQQGHIAKMCQDTACFYCKGLGHLKRDCPVRKRDQAAPYANAQRRSYITPPLNSSNGKSAPLVRTLDVATDYMVPIQLASGTGTYALVDTGAQVSLLSNTFSYLFSGCPGRQMRVYGVTGEATIGNVQSVKFQISGTEYTWNFVTIDMASDVVLGADFLKAHNAIISNDELRLEPPGRLLQGACSPDALVTARWSAVVVGRVQVEATFSSDVGKDKIPGTVHCSVTKDPDMEPPPLAPRRSDTPSRVSIPPKEVQCPGDASVSHVDESPSSDEPPLSTSDRQCSSRSVRKKRAHAKHGKVPFGRSRTQPGRYKALRTIQSNARSILKGTQRFLSPLRKPRRVGSSTFRRKKQEI